MDEMSRLFTLLIGISCLAPNSQIFLSPWFFSWEKDATGLSFGNITLLFSLKPAYDNILPIKKFKVSVVPTVKEKGNLGTCL